MSTWIHILKCKACTQVNGIIKYSNVLIGHPIYGTFFQKFMPGKCLMRWHITVIYESNTIHILCSSVWARVRNFHSLE